MAHCDRLGLSCVVSGCDDSLLGWICSTVSVSGFGTYLRIIY